MKGVIAIIRFYFTIAIYWFAFIAIFITLLKKFKYRVQVMKKSKFIIFLGIVIYFLLVSIFLQTGFVRPFLSKSNLEDLKVSEGIGVIRATGKGDELHLNSRDSDYFDLALCIPFINEGRLHDQKLVIWHKGRMVYQLTKNGEVVFSIDNANSNIARYNLLIVPLGYFSMASWVFLLCWGIAGIICSSETK